MRIQERRTVEVSGCPDLVVIYLGMRVRTPRGLLRLAGLGPRIERGARFARGGLEAIYDDVGRAIGLAAFAPTRTTRPGGCSRLPPGDVLGSPPGG